jgi:hypothetical protein
VEPPTPRPAIVRGNQDPSPASRLRRIVLKSILLNAIIVLTSFPVLAIAGGARVVVPTLAIMAGITLVIWTATFTLFSSVAIGRLLWKTFSTSTQRKPPIAARKGGVVDRWLDGPG